MPTSDSEYDKLHASGHAARRRVTFDPTINLGHMLTFAGFLAAGLSAYNSIDKRQTVQEISTQSIESRVATQSTQLDRALTELRADSKDTQRSVQALTQQLVILQATQKGNKP